MTGVASRLARDLVAYCGQSQPALKQNLRGHRALFAQESQKQMLCPYVAVLQSIRFFVRVMQHALGFRSQRPLDGSGDPFTQQRTTFDLSSNGFNGNLRAGKKASG